jgi:4-amino-4-deoxy-L-arabinose transferase-like glycosyltransferase
MAKNAVKSIAVISGYILASTGPMIFIHGARSGDYSPLFTFLVLLFIVFLYMSENNTIYLYAAGFIFSLSFLVYSFAAFQLLVLAGVYLFVTGLYKKINFKSGVGFVLFSFAPIGGWIVWRLNNVDGLLFFNFE